MSFNLLILPLTLIWCPGFGIDWSRRLNIRHLCWPGIQTPTFHFKSYNSDIYLEYTLLGTRPPNIGTPSPPSYVNRYQALVLVGVTGPVSIFSTTLYSICTSNGISFLPLVTRTPPSRYAYCIPDASYLTTSRCSGSPYMPLCFI